MSTQSTRNPDDCFKILVAIEPRAYRTVIVRAIQALRPRTEVIVVEPDALRAQVSRLQSGLVICGAPGLSADCEIAWVEFRPYDAASARVCIEGRRKLVREPGLSDLIWMVDEAERFAGRPPEEPRNLCLS